MVVTLEVLNTEANIRRVVITRTAVIGRGKECGLRIASQHISRRHCELILAKDAVRIRDLNSANGTFVNNKPLVPGVVFEIDPDDELRLGSVRLKIDFEPVIVERPVLKQPALQPPKGGLMGAIGAAAASVGHGDDAPPAPKLDLTAEVFAPKATEEGSDRDEISEPAFEDQETIAAVELPDDDVEDRPAAIEADIDGDDPELLATDDDDEIDDDEIEIGPDADLSDDDDEALNFLSDDVSSDEELPSFDVGNDDKSDDSAILDFLNNMD